MLLLLYQETELAKSVCSAGKAMPNIIPGKCGPILLYFGFPFSSVAFGSMKTPELLLYRDFDLLQEPFSSSDSSCLVQRMLHEKQTILIGRQCIPRGFFCC